MKRPLAYCSLVIALLFFSPRLLIADDTIAGLHAKAEAGDSKANFQLGMSYANGDRVKKDFKQAAAFYLRAATKGMPEAQFNLAALYFAGDGVPKDLVMAYVWWSLCGATGNKDAKEKIASLESQMTLEQKAQAMTAAREIILRTQAAEKTANPAGGSEAKQLAADPVSRTAEKKPLTNASTTSQDVTDPQRPKSRFRPTLTARYPGTSNIGPTAVDVRWSNHGAYLQRMIEGVQIQWETLLVKSKLSYPQGGGTVTVTFTMDSKGKIPSIVNIDSTVHDAASQVCVNAITDRAPYGDWTDDMKAALGEKQEMTFTFRYQ